MDTIFILVKWKKSFGIKELPSEICEVVQQVSVFIEEEETHGEVD